MLFSVLFLLTSDFKTLLIMTLGGDDINEVNVDNSVACYVTVLLASTLMLVDVLATFTSVDFL